MAGKRSWKFWTSRALLLLLLAGIFWTTNLIWFRPFNIRHFYDRIFLQFALKSPETVTGMGIPVLYDWSKDELNDVSDANLWENFNWAKAEELYLKARDISL